METGSCRCCGIEISAQANRCPECGADQSNPFKRIAGFLGSILLIIFVILVFLSTFSQNSSQNNSASENKSLPGDTASSAQPAAIPAQVVPAKGNATLPAREILKIQSRPYEILESDSSSATIYAPLALTKDERAHTVMRGAADLLAKTGSDQVSVIMVPDPDFKKCGHILAEANYQPYGFGWSVQAYGGSIDAHWIQMMRLECEYEAKYAWDYDRALRYIRKHMKKTEKEISDIPFLIPDLYPVSTDLAAAFGDSSPEDARAAAKKKNPALHFTKEKCIACFTQDSLQKLGIMISQEDWQAAQNMLSSLNCIQYPVNSLVYIMESPGYFVVKIRAKGDLEGLWTLRDFID
jgi:hypothetical protein